MTTTTTSDDDVPAQGTGRCIDCPICGSSRLYVFAVSGAVFASCGRCSMAVRWMPATSTIGEVKGQLIAACHP